MRNRVLLLLILLFFPLSLFFSCGRQVYIVPAEVEYPTSGIDTVDNRPVSGYYGSGFFFKTGRVIFFPNSNSVYPDISINIIQNANKPYFYSTDQYSLFKLMNSTSDSIAAFAYFDSLRVLEDTSGFVTSVSDLAIFNTFVVRDHYNKYAKILLTSIMVDSVNRTTEVGFKWVYQPDGSMSFSQ